MPAETLICRSILFSNFESFYQSKKLFIFQEPQPLTKNSYDKITTLKPNTECLEEVRIYTLILILLHNHFLSMLQCSVLTYANIITFQEPLPSTKKVYDKSAAPKSDTEVLKEVRIYKHYFIFFPTISQLVRV